MRLLLLVLVVALCFGVPSGAARAADDAPEDAGSESPPSTADRFTRIGKALESDRAKLERLKLELEQQRAFFDEITKGRERSDAKLAELRERLATGADPDEKKEIEAEIARYKKRSSLGRNQADITVETIKTLREQLTSLNAKIATDAAALRHQSGADDSSPPDTSGTPSAPVPAAPPATAAPAAREGPLAANPLFPTRLLATPADAVRAQASQPGAELQETTEQLEARIQAERMEQKAAAAEQEILNFIDRKQALEQQIELEQQLVDASRRSVANLELAHENAQDELTTRVERGADAAAVERRRQSIDRIATALHDAREELSQRLIDLEELEKRLEDAESDQQIVTDEATERRLAAEEARKHSIWLDSPVHPANIGSWAATRGPRILMVAIAAALLLFVTRFTARRLTGWMVRPGQRQRGGRQKRADTLALSFRSAANGAILIGALLLMLQEAGFNVKTVLGGAAIFGVAIAFGAQNLMRDFFNGFMILLEDQFELNDLLTIGSTTGRVEHVNLRTTVLRDLEGRVHFIPNGEIKLVINHTYEWSRAVIDICVGYSEDIDRVMERLIEIANDLRADVKFGGYITEPPEMLGVDRMNDFGPVIRMMLKTRSDRRFAVKREMLRRIANRFDELDIRLHDPDRIALQRPPTPGP